MKPDISQVYNVLVNLLDEAEARWKNAELKNKYIQDNNMEELRILERHGYEGVAIQAWTAAKHLYCDNKDALDKFYEENKDQLLVYSSRRNDLFEKCRQSIANEMTDGLETIVLNSESNDNKTEEGS